MDGRAADASRSRGSPAVAGALLGVPAVTEAIARAAVIGVSVQVGLVLCAARPRDDAAARAFASRGRGPGRDGRVRHLPGLLPHHHRRRCRRGADRPLPAGSRRAAGTGNAARGRGAGDPVHPARAGGAPSGRVRGGRPDRPARRALARSRGWAGVARRAQAEARAQSAARAGHRRQPLEHTARGERARIARELHDIVAHHISMIAVQAETARLTTPGLPAAGARQLIADRRHRPRPRSTEMRRLLGVLREDAAGRTRRPAAAARSGPAQRSARPGPRDVADRRAPHRQRYAVPARPGGGARRLPDHPGGAHQRAPPRTGGGGRRRAPDTPAAALWLRIRDNGPGPPRRRRRAVTACSACASGRPPSAAQLHTGPASGGGFLVEATLPQTAEAPAMTPAPTPVRIVVADDQQVVRDGFAALLETQPDFTVVGTASDGDDAARICRRAAPRRRADGCPHARHGRHRGHQAGSPKTHTRRACSS